MGDDSCTMPTTPTQATPADLVADLLAGASASHLRDSIWALSIDDYRDLCCTLCCMRNEVAANSPERADEIDRFLASTNNGSPVINCRIYARSSWCPLIDAAPLGS